MAELTVEVGGMTCGHCIAAIEAAVGSIDGVERVTADLPSGRVDVTFSGLADERSIRAAIEEEGYAVLAVTGPPA